MSAGVGGFLIGLFTGGWTVLVVMCAIASNDKGRRR